MPGTQILVVEDEYIVAKDIQNTLTNLGYSVPAIASSGEEAIKKIDEHSPDLVLMDIVLKGKMDGVEAADKIRLKFNIPVVYLTAYADDNTLQRAKVTEPYGYLIKPFQERELHSTIEMALYRQKMERSLKDSEERYRKLVDNFPEPMAVISEGKFHYFNSAVIDLLKASGSGELIGKSVIDFIHPDNQEYLNACIHELAIGDVDEKSCSIKILRLDGEIVDVDMNGIPIIYTGIPAIQMVLRDITERHHMENVLRESEEKYRSLVERANDGIAIIQDGMLKYANPAICKMTRYKLEELIDTSFTNYLHPDDKDNVIEHYRRRMAGEDVPSIYEASLRDKSGYKVEIEINAGIVKYHGKPADLVIVRNISERKIVENALRESEEKYRRLIETSPDGIIYTDLKGRVIMVNKIGLDMYGCKKDEDIIGKNVFEFISPVDRDRAAANAQRVLKSGWIKSVEYTLLKKDGTPYHSELSSALIRDANNNPKGFLGIVRDISERIKIDEALKESEEKYKQIAENSIDAVAMAQEGKIIYANEAYCEIFGYTREELFGQSLLLIVAPEDKELIKKRAKNRLQGKKEPNRYEFKGMKKNGTIITIEVSTAEAFMYNNKPTIIAILRDISKRKQAEQALIESEEKYRLLVDNINDGVYTLDENGYFTFVNKVIEKRSGLSQEKFKRINFKDIVSPNDIERVQENFRKIMGGEDVPPYELEYTTSDGSGLEVEVNTKPIYKEGKIVGIQGISRDISERKLRERILQESEAQLSITLNNMADAIHVIDNNYRIVMMNKSFIKWNEELGLDTNVIGKNVMDIFKFLSEEVLIQYKNVFETGETIITEEKNMIGDQEFITETRKIPILEHGKVMQVITVIRDITNRKMMEEELRKNEERFRNIFENATVGIYRTSPEGKILMVNPKLVEMLGYSSFEELTERNLEENGFEPEYPRDEFKSRMESEGQVLGLESIWKRLDGSKLYVRESARAILDENNKISYYEGIIEDITERKKAEQEIIDERNRAELYLDILAHDINNFNQTILTSNELMLMKEDLPVDIKKYVQNSIEQANEISNIILNLQNLSKLSKEEFKLEKTNAKEILQKSINKVNSTFVSKEININYNKPDIEVLINGNELLENVFDNLINNAIKHSTKEQINLDISIDFEESKDSWKFEFKDNGPGIPFEVKENIFKHVISSKGSTKGLGMGLTIVNEIITRYNGKIWVEDNIKNDHTHGSNFIIILPKIK